MQASRIVCDLIPDPKMRVDKAITNNDGSNIDEQEMRKIHEEVMAKMQTDKDHSAEPSVLFSVLRILEFGVSSSGEPNPTPEHLLFQQE